MFGGEGTLKKMRRLMNVVPGRIAKEKASMND